jgi:hypothetical protein
LLLFCPKAALANSSAVSMSPPAHNVLGEKHVPKTRSRIVRPSRGSPLTSCPKRRRKRLPESNAPRQRLLNP